MTRPLTAPTRAFRNPRLRLSLFIACTLVLLGTAVQAQEATPAPTRAVVATSTRAYPLVNATERPETDDIVTALRNMLPNARVYVEYTGHAVIVGGSPDDQAAARAMITMLDQPRKMYRLTYTILDLNDGRPLGSEHYSLIVVSGVRNTLKQGSRIPVVSGSYPGGADPSRYQYQYIDVGLNIDASVDTVADGVRLRTKVEQTGIVPTDTRTTAGYPGTRQTTMEGTSLLTLGKPLTIGSLDLPDSTRHQDVQVTIEAIR